VREDLSLCARAKLLGDRSEIADDDDTAEQYEYSSFARAREKAPNLLLLGEEEEEEHTRGENSNVFFFPENKSERTRKKKNKEIKRDFQALPKEERTTPFLLLLFVLVFFVLLLLLLACTRLLFATAPAFRGHRSAFIVIIILYIFVLFVYYLPAFVVVWGSKISLFLSFSFSETTDRQTHTLRPLTR
jgi:pilus assembly protein TadC